MQHIFFIPLTRRLYFIVSFIPPCLTGLLSMSEDRLSYLFHRYINNQCTPAEKKEFFELLKRPDLEQPAKQLLDQLIEKEDAAPLKRHMSSEVAQSIFGSIIEADAEPAENPTSTPVLRRMRFSRLAAACILGLVLSVTAYFLFRPISKETDVAITSSNVTHDVLPGKDKAVLLMADGSEILLDNTANGDLNGNQSAKVIKENGLLTYQSNNDTTVTEYNTINTPRGGQYRLVLADGTKVWLNAASSLRFPASFTGDKREVVLTGEGYFEVAKDASKPFFVQSGEMNVQVLGTHFNINAYGDEAALETTLLEGSVKVSSPGGVRTLAPGQQARIKEQTVQLVKDVDVEGVVAWKNGLFQLNSVDITTIMKQLSRWYDVEVKYEGEIPVAHISGKMSRALNLSQVLKVLEYSGIHCKIEGRTLVVLPENN